MCILLSIITCGIYYIYWMYLLVKNTRSIQKNTDKCTGEMLCLIFVPFYSLYWWYTRGEKVRQGFAEHDCNATGGGVLYLVLAILGLSIVSMAIMQSDFNSLKSEIHSEQRSTILTMSPSFVQALLTVNSLLTCTHPSPMVRAPPAAMWFFSPSPSLYIAFTTTVVPSSGVVSPKVVLTSLTSYSSTYFVPGTNLTDC